MPYGNIISPKSVILPNAKHSRPVFAVKDGNIVIEDVHSSVDKKVLDKLKQARNHLEKCLPAVDRIEINWVGSQTGDLVGTGWLVKPDVIVTNAHVAKKIDNTPYRRINFLAEKGNFATKRILIKKILWKGAGDDPDIAFLKLEHAADAAYISLCGKPTEGGKSIEGMQVAVIGYPLKLSHTIFQGHYTYKCVSPGKCVSPETINASQKEAIMHDCSTTEGPSGSLLIGLDTGEAVGLHCCGAGGAVKYNQAVPARLVKKQLDALDIS